MGNAETEKAGRQVGVVYLVWVPAGVEAARRFLDSYNACPGGLPHHLTVAYKSYQNPEELLPFQSLMAAVPHEEIQLPEAVLDIDAYVSAAQRVPQAHVCFLNTACVLLDADWLCKLYAHGSKAGVGAAGATGSWHGRHSAGNREDYGRWRHYAVNTARMAWRNRHYQAFPNPHVRTNAFLMERERFLNLQHPVIRGKEDAHRFEHGKHSLTRQLHRQGLKTLLVGRDGQAYDVEAWPRSGTYCCGEQSNLLVADNRTRAYENADTQERAAMRRLIWGEA